MSRKSKSALALYCASIRAGRGHTQASFCAAVDIEVNALKPIERGNPVSLERLAAIYRDGMPKKLRLKDDEWFQMLMYWVTDRISDGGRAKVERDALPTGVDAVNEKQGVAVKKLATAASKLTPQIVALLTQVAESFAKDPGEHKADLLTAFVAMGGK